jgi:hypothetical protein
MYGRFASTAVAFVFGAAAFLDPASLMAQVEEITETRKTLIARSKVWRPTGIASMNLKRGPESPGAFAPGETVTCDYVDKQLSGASPKFACRLPDGDELKVKYGGANGEVYGEVAASRLLWALGFGADRMYPVRVVCRGCPEKIGGIRRANGDRIVDPASVERKLSDRELADKWDWDELELTDESAGGATKAERDALTLLAVLLQHSDSKAGQQRIVCLDESTDEGERCDAPLMMINALNQQPRASVNLAEWMKLPIWKGREGCVGNLVGSWTGTLKNPVISEAGRQFLADLLVQLSDQQLRDMFETARVHLRTRAPASARSGLATADEWVSAFKQKRTEIVERRCAA